MVSGPTKRVLIDWDWGASGTWTVLSAEELSGPAPRARLVPADPALQKASPHPWSDKLSEDLLDALQQWNDHGGELFHPRSSEATWEAGIDAFRSRGAELARRTQRELGADYEVLFVTSTGAWQWVTPPWFATDSV